MNLGIIKSLNCTTFIIENSCLSNLPPIHKLFEDGFSTKGTDRGFGLNIVRRLINKKYPNILLNTKIESEIFKHELIINNKKR